MGRVTATATSAATSSGSLSRSTQTATTASPIRYDEVDQWNSMNERALLVARKTKVLLSRYAMRMPITKATV